MFSRQIFFLPLVLVCDKGAKLPDVVQLNCGENNMVI